MIEIPSRHPSPSVSAEPPAAPVAPPPAKAKPAAARSAKARKTVAPDVSDERYQQVRRRLFLAHIQQLREKTLKVEQELAAAQAREAQALAQPPVAPVVTPGLSTGTSPAQPSPQSVAAPRKPRRWLRTLTSALVFVGLPVLAASFYFGCFASDQYEATAQFAIRSNAPLNLNLGGQGGGLGSLLGGYPAEALTDVYIVQQYIESPQILQDLKPYLDVRAIYGKPTADRLARLDPKISDEELPNYWRSRVQVQVDNTTGLAQLSVRAFTAAEAKQLADCILVLSEMLVNHLSERSAADMTTLAQKESNDAYARVLKSLDDLQAYAEKSRQIDPLALAKTQSEIQGRLDADYVTFKTQLDVLRKYLPEDAPRVRQLQSALASIASQLAQQKAEASATASPDSLSNILSTFDKLGLQQQFAEKAYLSSLDSLEQSRVEAMSQTRYLEAFVQPHLADYAAYPERLKDIAWTALIAVMLWILGSLVVAAAREHL